VTIVSQTTNVTNINLQQHDDRKRGAEL
jgi:hypothetical protein